MANDLTKHRSIKKKTKSAIDRYLDGLKEGDRTALHPLRQESDRQSSIESRTEEILTEMLESSQDNAKGDDDDADREGNDRGRSKS